MCLWNLTIWISRLFKLFSFLYQLSLLSSWWKYWRTALSQIVKIHLINIYIHFGFSFERLESDYFTLFDFWLLKTPLGCQGYCVGTLDKRHVPKRGIILTQALRGCVNTTRWLHKGVHQANMENGYTSSTNAAWVWGCAIWQRFA